MDLALSCFIAPPYGWYEGVFFVFFLLFFGIFPDFSSFSSFILVEWLVFSHFSGENGAKKYCVSSCPVHPLTPPV